MESDSSGGLGAGDLEADVPPSPAARPPSAAAQSPRPELGSTQTKSMESGAIFSLSKRCEQRRMPTGRPPLRVGIVATTDRAVQLLAAVVKDLAMK